MFFRMKQFYWNISESRYTEMEGEMFLLSNAIKAIRIDGENQFGRIITDYDPHYPIIVKAQDALEIFEKLQAQNNQSKGV